MRPGLWPGKVVTESTSGGSVLGKPNRSIRNYLVNYPQRLHLSLSLDELGSCLIAVTALDFLNLRKVRHQEMGTEACIVEIASYLPKSQVRHPKRHVHGVAKQPIPSVFRIALFSGTT